MACPMIPRLRSRTTHSVQKYHAYYIADQTHTQRPFPFPVRGHTAASTSPQYWPILLLMMQARAGSQASAGRRKLLDCNNVSNAVIRNYGVFSAASQQKKVCHESQLICRYTVDRSTLLSRNAIWEKFIEADPRIQFCPLAFSTSAGFY